MGNIDIERTGRVMLQPLAEVGVRVLVPIVVSRRQLVMDILRHSKRRNGEQKQDEADRHSALKKAGQTSYGSVESH
jgi:hypothetical protein